MPHSKIKTENYQNLGGINVKASPYITGPLEFLDLKNLDFQQPGSLSQRWGSTQYIGPSSFAAIRSFYEYEKLSGFSQIVFGYSGALWANLAGNATAGVSLAEAGLSLSLLCQIEDFVYSAGSAAFIPVVDQLNSPDFDQVISCLFQFEAPGMQFQNLMSFETFVDQMFVADGNNFSKYNGSFISRVGLPPIFKDQSPSIVGSSAGGSFLIPGVQHYFYGSYVNNRGLEGPVFPLGSVDTTAGGGATVALNGATVNSIYGATNIVVSYNIQTPLSYGISYINIYAYVGASQMKFSNGNTLPWGFPARFLAKHAASGSTLTTINIGSNAAGWTGLVNGIPMPIDNVYPLGFAATYGGLGYGPVRLDDFIIAPRYNPKYLEIYNNQMIMAGSSLFLSSIFWSEIGDPESVREESFAEIRTNDGDRITGIRSYLSRLYIFKKNSMHVLSGQDPDNFQLNQVSDQYGCVSNRAIAIYNDTMLFLDRKGVMRFNGANLDCISDKIEPIINRINYTAALDNATAVHDKQRQVVMFGVPIDGSTTNNFTLVYDYLVNAWTTEDGYNPSQFVVAQGRLSNNTVMYANYSGLILNFGSTFASDNGVGFSCYLKSRFLHDLGESVEKQWRRLFINVDPIIGSTVALNINFFRNFGTTVQINRTLYSNPFQSRTDFGISGKSLAFELSKYDTSTIFKFHGFSVDYRFQRAV